MVRPRDRSNRLQRDEIRISKSWLGKFVGKEHMPLTCPRCGWPCVYLTRPYYDSPWKEFGGFCGACVDEAVKTFDQKGWPVDPHEAPEAPAVEPEAPPQLFG